MIVEALLVGLVLGFLFYEWVGISPGGVIAPGYFALYVRQPQMAATTLALSVVVFVLLELLASRLILYGRRKLLLALLIGFCLKLGLEGLVQPLPEVGLDLRSIGYLIPGLVGHEMARQRVLPTALALGVVTIMVHLVLLAA